MTKPSPLERSLSPPSNALPTSTLGTKGAQMCQAQQLLSPPFAVALSGASRERLLLKALNALRGEFECGACSTKPMELGHHQPKYKPQLEFEADMFRINELMKPRHPLPWPVLKWKWPLTHPERISELEVLLNVRDFETQYENIRAAIARRCSFPVNETCSSDVTYFSARNIVAFKDLGFPCWAEGCFQQLIP
jgi:hypothetical protein